MVITPRPLLERVRLFLWRHRRGFAVLYLGVLVLLSVAVWQYLEERDDLLRTVSAKRKKSVARYGYTVLPCQGCPASKQEEAQKHVDALEFFYRNLTCENALDLSERGGFKLLARQMMERKLVGRRTSSKLPELIELVMARPLVHAGTITKALGVTPQAALRLVGELGLREMTGRGRFRAWGVI